MDSVSYERGRFYASRNGFRFAGSATGVYLADTVRSHVSPEVPRSPGIEEAFIARNDADVPHSDDALFYSHFALKAADLAQAARVRDALEHYFSTWHPLFPFLDGGYIIDLFECAAERAARAPTDGGSGEALAFPDLKIEEAMLLSAIFLAILAIADMNGDDQLSRRPELPRLQSSTQATLLSSLIVGACQNGAVSDTLAIQALIAIMLYFYLSRTLRPAMHLSGTVAKLAYGAGLHRCPDRFLQTFTDSADREMRKRVFYSLYVLDRLLTAEFGIPIMLHDTDIDTCVPGGIEHHPTQDTPSDHPARTPLGGLQLPNGSSPEDRKATADGGSLRSRKRPRRETDHVPSPLRASSTSNAEGSPRTTGDGAVDGHPGVCAGSAGTPAQPLPPATRLLPTYSLVTISKIVGRAMEVFNKSLLYRSLNELEQWWNDIGFDSEEETHVGFACMNLADKDPRTQYRTLFTCLYHHQIINLCRPSLSLAPSQLQHAHALQTCVASARAICATLARELAGSIPAVLWPGYVDMVFFSCLILVYGNRRDAANGTAHPTRLNSELRRAVRILEKLQTRWNVRPFTKVLEHLLDPTAGVAAAGAAVGAALAGPGSGGSAASGAGGGPTALGSLDAVTDVGQLFDPFLFDFDTFELNPDSIWAFHVSLPGSPAPGPMPNAS